MPMKVTTGLIKKIGPSASGSLGASCALEVECEQRLLFEDAAAFHERLSKLFARCRSAVEEELRPAAPAERPSSTTQRELFLDPAGTGCPCDVAGHHASTNQLSTNHLSANHLSANHLSANHLSANHLSANQHSANQHSANQHSANQHSANQLSANHDPANLATDRQIDFARQLARQIRALGGQRLIELSQQIYGRPMEELRSSEALELIELLKELRAGSKSVNELLPGAAT